MTAVAPGRMAFCSGKSDLGSCQLWIAKGEFGTNENGLILHMGMYVFVGLCYLRRVTHSPHNVLVELVCAGDLDGGCVRSVGLIGVPGDVDGRF